jgi:hypothetical protein
MFGLADAMLVQVQKDRYLEWARLEHLELAWDRNSAARWDSHRLAKRRLDAGIPTTRGHHADDPARLDSRVRDLNH